MGDEVLSQNQAWAVYDRWLEDRRVVLVEEPPAIERRFERSPGADARGEADQQVRIAVAMIAGE